MRLLHTSDWHVGRRLRGKDRDAEHEAVLGELVELADSQSVDLTIVSGDLFDSASPSPSAERIVWRALLDLSEISPVVAIAGNHDNSDRFDAMRPVIEGTGVRLIGRPRGPDDGGVVVFDDIGVRVAALPFLSRRGVVMAEQLMETDPDQQAGEFQDRVRRLINLLCADMTPDTVNILTSHISVYGAETGGGEHIFDYAVPASVFPSFLSYVALGHYHREQQLPGAGAVRYAGSPMQLDFGEVADAKASLLVDAEAGKPARVTSVPVEAGARLVTLRGDLSEVVSSAGEAEDAFVKVVLTERARVGLADEVRDAIPNVVDVTLDKPDSLRKSRQTARSLEPSQAFAQYLDELNIEDPALLRMFNEVYEEAVGSDHSP